MRRIQLSEPINGSRGKIEHIDLREPKFRDYMETGSPAIWVSIGDGGCEAETPSVMREWVERLAGIDPNLLAGLPLRDALALGDAILDFFREARSPVSSKSTGSLDTSSSGSAGTFEPSRI